MRTVSCLHPSYGSPQWQQWLEELPRLADAAPQEQFLQKARNHVFWLETRGRRLVVKRFFNRGAWKKLVYRVSSSKARRSYEHSLRLLQAGVSTPQPVAWREDWEGAWLAESYYVCEHLDFAHEGRELKDPSTEDRELKASLIGQTIGRMHQAGLQHLDLTPGNFLFLKDGSAGWSLHIVDNNRMRFGPVPADQGVDSLLQADLEGAPLEAAMDAYAKERGLAAADCRARYQARLRRYQLKWRLKDATRPWRRKIGL